MIKIQLCPPEELENPLWWVPDVAVAVLVVAAGYLGAQYYLGTIQEQVDTVETQAKSLKDSTEALKPDLERFKTLDGDIAALNTKLNALKKITVSKIARYKPLIAVEHFQNLRPEGVWFKSLKIGINGKDEFDLVAQAFDNLIIAEFMTAIRATDSQDKDDGDLRTQVAFTELALADSVLGQPGGQQQGGPEGEGGGGASRSLAAYPTFHLKGRFVERTGPALPLGDGAAGSGSGSGSGKPRGSGAKPAAKPAQPVISQGPDNDDNVKF